MSGPRYSAAADPPEIEDKDEEHVEVDRSFRWRDFKRGRKEWKDYLCAFTDKSSIDVVWNEEH